MGPVLAVVSPWLPEPGEPLPVGLTSVLPDAGKLDVGGGAAEEEDAAGLELPGAGADVLTPGLAV